MGSPHGLNGRRLGAYEHALLILDSVEIDGPAIDYPQEPVPAGLLARAGRPLRNSSHTALRPPLPAELLLAMLLDARELDLHGRAESAPPG